MNRAEKANLFETHRGISSHLAEKVRILTATEIEMIHQTSLKILTETGILIEHEGIKEMLNSMGAEVKGDLVKIPPSIIENAVNDAPQRVTLYARDPKQNVHLGEGRVHFTSGFGATFVRDLETREIRKANMADLELFTRVADYLDRVDICLFPVVPQDIDPRLLDVECTAAVLANTSKHIQLSLETSEWIEEVIAMAEAVCGKDSPLCISAGGVPHSPLRYTRDVAEKFYLLGRHNIPCFIVVGGMAGATMPVTLAGTLALQNAEFLAGVVINQLGKKGAPVVYGTFTGGFDMRATKLAGGGPELMLITSATQQLADFYHIPVGYATGGLTDSNQSDLQCGVEKAGGILSAALSGVDVIHDAVSGLLGNGMITDLAQLYIDNEISKSIEFFLKGIPVTEDSLALDVIHSIGPGGNFLVTDHTARHFRTSLWLSPIRSRNSIIDQEQVSPYYENAARYVMKIIETHKPIPINEKKMNAVHQIVQTARQKISGLPQERQ